MPDQKSQYPPIPTDDPKHTLTLVDSDRDQTSMSVEKLSAVLKRL